MTVVLLIWYGCGLTLTLHLGILLGLVVASQAAAIEGLETSVVTDYILKVSTVISFPKHW